MSEKPTLASALVVAAHGRHFLIESLDGKRQICHPRGKKSDVVVGDRVLWQPASTDEGVIERIEERRNLFYRRDEVRTKSFAANLDQILVLVAAEPEFSESQLARSLIAAEAAGIDACIGVNKSDLGSAFERAWGRLEPYRRMDYRVLPLSLRHGSEADRQRLLETMQGKTTLILGPSGAGKSTLINLLVPQATAVTGEISVALGAGRHTTTSTALYWVDPARTTALIDSPGFQEFGLQHIAPAQLAGLMPDIAANATACKFYNCSHLHEPGCGVISAVGPASTAHPISVSRYRIYSELFAEMGQTRY